MEEALGSGEYRMPNYNHYIKCYETRNKVLELDSKYQKSKSKIKVN